VMTVRAATKSFLERFHLTAADVSGKVLLDVGKKRWNAPALRSLLKRMHEADGGIEEGIVEHDFTGEGRPRRWRFAGRRIPFEDTKWTVLTLEDLTDADDTP